MISLISKIVCDFFLSFFIFFSFVSLTERKNHCRYNRELDALSIADPFRRGTVPTLVDSEKNGDPL